MTTRVASILVNIGDAVTARPTAKSRVAIIVQLLLILLWHPIILVGCETAFGLAVDFTSWYWQQIDLASLVMRAISSLYPSEGKIISFFCLLTFWSTVVVALEGAIAYIPFRIVTRRVRPVWFLFCRSWWRACLWGTAVMLVFASTQALLPVQPIFEWLPLCMWIYLLAAPAFLARKELHQQRRLSHWRPVCPECGYSLRKLHSDRCPECGVGFPTSSRTFRRWAIQRLSWDRLQRGSLVFSYLCSAATIVFCPCRAARRLSIPDRRGRAIRWGVVHVFLAALLCATLGQEMYLVHWMFQSLLDSPFVMPELTELWRPPAGRVLLWSLQSLITWSMAVASLPMLGMALGIVVPGRHPAARFGIVKWSLYTSIVIILVLTAWYGSVLSLVPWRPEPVYVTLQYISVPCPPLLLPAGLYSIWWARGVCVNPYLRVRGLKVFLVNWFVFMTMWLVLTKLLLAPGPLVDLL